MNFTNTRLRLRNIRTRGLKSRLRRYRLRRAVRPRRLIRTYSYYKRKTGGAGIGSNLIRSRRARRVEDNYGNEGYYGNEGSYGNEGYYY